LLARHLVTARGVRHLILVGRRGPDADGMAELRDDLASAGAEVTVVACDVADRDALAALIGRIPAGRPLTAVVHAAGVLDDAVVGSLTEPRIRALLAPKAGAARHLHELTATRPSVRMFALFSSGAATLGTAGQSGYAAANAVLDALAAHRAARGLPAVSLGWGLWSEASAMTRDLADQDRQRLRRGGIRPLSVEDGLALFDATAAGTRPHVLPIRLDPREAAEVAPLLRELAPAPATPADAGGAPLAGRFAAAGEDQRDAVLVLGVRELAAAVLGHAGPAAVPPDGRFLDLGFDSLTAVELRNRLNAATGLRLPTTLAFDCPTPAAVARELRERLDEPAEVPADRLAGELDRITAALSALPAAALAAAGIGDRLNRLVALGPAAGWPDRPGADHPDPDELSDRLRSASDDEIFSFIENELGQGDTFA
jgi:acyl carrier protein